MTRSLRAAFGACLGLALLPALAHAQTAPPKIGYTDHEILLANMPQMATVRQTMQTAIQQSQQTLGARQQRLQTRVEEYQRRQSLLSAEVRQQRERELGALQDSLQAEAGAAQQALGAREAELMRPLYESLQNAIDAEAQAKGLDVVLPTQVGGQPLILYVNRDRVTDITRDVARRLGIQVNDESAPGATPAAGGAPTRPAGTPPRGNN